MSLPFKNKMKTIEFIPAYEFVSYVDIDPPLPANHFLPKWYKELNLHIHKSITSYRVPLTQQLNFTAKACVPLKDSITSGYILTTPCDITFVDPNIYGHRVIWTMDFDVIDTHTKEQTNGLMVDGYEKVAYKLNSVWGIKAPKGYSILYTHPFYNFDLPFLTMSAIIDSDIFYKQANLPFLIKDNFIGTIEKGTPFCQIIPIKRDRWNSKVKQYNKNDSALSWYQNLVLKSSFSYRKRFWQKKSYR